ncbi:protein-L-isoaspartate O-methyltransferase 1 isoform X3 [Setaria viridis]|uniref:protein-L-isoaspartate O-methyltransferase 1 isoform X3 n=1 Tax=Setaria viridis TaxID=4556 RepID=UPI003B3A2D4B
MAVHQSSLPPRVGLVWAVISPPAPGHHGCAALSHLESSFSLPVFSGRFLLPAPTPQPPAAPNPREESRRHQSLDAPRRHGGTGYLTACFALMVGSEGRAVGVEHIPELVATSIENIKKSAAAPQLNDGSLSIHIADGREGWPELAPYDAIHVGAAAPQIPEALIEQLKPGGRMVIPVGTVFQELKVVDKKLDGTVSIRDETSVRYVPLTSKEAQLHAN